MGREWRRRWPVEHMAEEAEFNELVVARGSALMGTAYLLTQDHQLAEDLLQTRCSRRLSVGNASSMTRSPRSGGPLHREHL
jgi:hypothetical protein